MDVLKIAIREAGSASKLARELEIKPNVVGNWKISSRGLPHAWEKVLRLKYADAIAASEAAKPTANTDAQVAAGQGA